MLSRRFIKREAVKFFAAACDHYGFDGYFRVNEDGYEELYVIAPDGAERCAEIDYPWFQNLYNEVSRDEASWQIINRIASQMVSDNAIFSTSIVDATPDDWSYLGKIGMDFMEFIYLY